MDVDRHRVQRMSVLPHWRSLINPGPAATVSSPPLLFVPPRHKYSLDRRVRGRRTACDGLPLPLAARFGCAVNSKPGPKKGQEGNDAKSGRILEPALRIHAG